MKHRRNPSLFGVNDDFSEDFLSLDDLLIKHPQATFFFRASNDSLAPEIYKGDILIVDRSRSPRAGDIVILYHQGERLCRRWPVQLTEIEVFGVVTSHVREYR